MESSSRRQTSIPTQCSIASPFHRRSGTYALGSLQRASHRLVFTFLRWAPRTLTTFMGPFPVTAPLTDEAIGGRYVYETGLAIVRHFKEHGIDPLAVPACLVNGHAPFCWGCDPHHAAHNAVVLEAVARMAYRTLTLNAECPGVSQALLDRHYHRKHGSNATYGQ